jgi:c-di-GMP-binding flagellar brake protein YcgR
METENEGRVGRVHFGLANFERRKYPRFSVNLPIEYFLVETPNGHKGRATNLSEGGLMVYLSEKPEKGQILHVKLFFPSVPDLQAVEMLGQVVWVDSICVDNGDYRVGLEFINAAPADIDQLKSFLNNLSQIG